MQVDLRAAGPGGVERSLEDAALRVVVEAGEAAGVQRQRRGHDGGRCRAGGTAGECHEREENAAPGARGPAHARGDHAAADCLSVGWFMRIRSAAPPMNSPLTKIIGNVVHPVHSFNGRRLRHWLT